MSVHTFLRYFNGTRIIAFESLPAKSGKNEKGVRIYILTPFAVDRKIYREKSLFGIGIALPDELELLFGNGAHLLESCWGLTS